MQVTKTLIALAVAAGFASASFAQGSTPAAPAAKATVTAEKKMEAPKAAEAPKADVGKPVAKHAKAKGHAHKSGKHAGKTTMAPAPASK